LIVVPASQRAVTFPTHSPSLVSADSQLGVHWRRKQFPQENKMNPVQQPTSSPDASQASTKGRASLSVTDNRTGKSYDLPLNDAAIHATDLRQIKTGADDFGLMTYDPAFNNTAACISLISYIDGDKGILRYRGY